MQQDKVLIVDADPDARSLLREGVLGASRFQVFEAQDAAGGLEQVRKNSPELIIVDVVMPGLSGADFLVALNSLGYSGPIIVETVRGKEAMAIDCFRLGATDYLTKPLRETEALQVIERGLNEVHLRRERQQLMDRLQESNKQLEARIKNLTTLGSIGKSVSGLLDLEQLFPRVLEAAVAMTEADHATLILRDEEANRLVLRAGKNVSLAVQERLGQPVNDGIANLVMTSGEPLLISGDSLKRFQVGSDVFALIYAPLMIQGKAIGVLTVGNHRKRRTFDNTTSGLLEILAGYAAIAIVNARLFATLERRARTIEQAYEELKARETSREQALAGITHLQQDLVAVRSDLTKLVRESGSLPRKLSEPLGALDQKIGGLLDAVEALSRRENGRKK